MNVDEISSAGDNLSMVSDQCLIVRAIDEIKLKFCLQNHIKAKISFIGTNEETSVLCLCAWLATARVAFLTSPHAPGVTCEDKYFFTTGEVPVVPASMCTGPKISKTPTFVVEKEEH